MFRPTRCQGIGIIREKQNVGKTDFGLTSLARPSERSVRATAKN